MRARPSFAVMVITDEGPDLLERVARALAGAAPSELALQLRDKHASDAALLPLARELRTLTERAGAYLLVNARVELACDVRADGVHLPSHGFDVAGVRRTLPDSMWLGLSCHDDRELGIANAHCDYALLSPFGQVPGKAAPLGSRRFMALAQSVSIPVYGLGGITTEGVPDVVGAGAAGVAVVRAVLGAADPQQAVSALIASTRGTGATGPRERTSS